MKSALVLAIALSACATTPTPTPGLGDEFSNYIAKCDGQPVEMQTPDALEPVERCLGDWAPGVSTVDVLAVSACLIAAADHYSRDTVACVVRDRGAEATARTQYGGDEREIRIADAAGAWIRAEGIGYR